MSKANFFAGAICIIAAISIDITLGCSAPLHAAPSKPDLQITNPEVLAASDDTDIYATIYRFEDRGERVVCYVINSGNHNPSISCVPKLGFR